MATMFQQQTEWESKSGVKECSCKKGEKVFYQCREKSCLNHLSQPIYCISCLNEGKHIHFPQHKIIEVIQQSDNRWSTLKERFETVVKRAKVSYRRMEPLILYFEAESLRIPAHLLSNNGVDRWCITPDFQRLLASYSELETHV